jgi:hypothetical protein
MIAEYAAKATSDIYVLEDYWWRKRYTLPNIGVITGKASGVLVFDADLYKPEGATSYTDILRVHGEMPATATAKSGSGKGRHLFYKWDPRLDTITARMYRPWPGIEIFCGGTALVVLPPSRHKSGNFYEWLRSPAEVELAAPPEWLVEALLDEHEAAEKFEANRASEREARDWLEPDVRAVELKEAFDYYRAANPLDAPARNGPCPMCGSPDGFKRAKGDPRYWCCHSARHDAVKVGRMNRDGSWSGDIIDVRAHVLGIYVPGEAATSRILLLKQEGYIE